MIIGRIMAGLVIIFAVLVWITSPPALYVSTICLCIGILSIIICIVEGYLFLLYGNTSSINAQSNAVLDCCLLALIGIIGIVISLIV